MESSPLLIGSFIVYSLFVVGVGLYSSRHKKHTGDDFVLANRELGPWAASLSASASSESGWVMLGLVGMAFSSGYAAFWIVPGIAAGYFFNWFVLAERLRKSTASTGAVTITQYIMHRFGRTSSALKWISSLIIVAAMLGYVAAQMNAAGKAFDAVFHLPYWVGVLVGAGIILAYTITGGFRAICWTDIVQGTFMLIALVGMPIVMLAHEGGFAFVSNTLGSQTPELLTISGGQAGTALFGFVIGMLGIGLGYPGQPQVLARFMASKDTRTVTRAGYISLTWMVIVYIGAILFGVFARAWYGTLVDPEQALPLACGELLPPILAGFVIAAIVSAICSTADSQLIVVSSTVSRDLFARRDRVDGSVDSKYVWWDRWMLIALGVLSVLAALTENRVIFEFVLYAWSALGASFGPLVILGLLWKRTSKAGAIGGMLTGVGTTIVWRNVPSLKAMVYELVPAFIFAFAVIIVLSLLFPDRETATRQ